MAFLSHNPVIINQFNIGGRNIKMTTFDMSKNANKGREALDNHMIKNSDLIFLQQVPNDNIKELFENRLIIDFNRAVPRSFKSVIVKRTFATNMEPINGGPDEIQDRMCAQKLTLHGGSILIAISWHGLQNVRKEDTFGQLLRFAKLTKRTTGAKHVIIGGNFNIKDEKVKEWLTNDEDGFKVEAQSSEVLKGYRHDKENVDYFVYSSTGIVQVPSYSIDINRELDITIPQLENELACDRHHLIQLISESNLDDVQPQIDDAGNECNKLHLPDQLLGVAENVEANEECGRKHLLEVLINADHDTIRDFINIIYNNM